MSLRSCFLSVTLLLSASFVAHADTVSTFDVSGTFASPTFDGSTNGTLSGTLLIDTTTGIIVSGDFTENIAGASYVFDSAANSNTYYSTLNVTEINFGDEAGDANFDFIFEGQPLVGYAGGPLCSVSNLCGTRRSDLAVGNGSPTNYLEQGTVTPTPEPSTFVLLGTGLLGLAGAGRRRFLTK